MAEPLSRDLCEALARAYPEVREHVPAAGDSYVVVPSGVGLPRTLAEAPEEYRAAFLTHCAHEHDDAWEEWGEPGPWAERSPEDRERWAEARLKWLWTDAEFGAGSYPSGHLVVIGPDGNVVDEEVNDYTLCGSPMIQDSMIAAVWSHSQVPVPFLPGPRPWAIWCPRLEDLLELAIKKGSVVVPSQFRRRSSTPGPFALLATDAAGIGYEANERFERYFEFSRVRADGWSIGGIVGHGGTPAEAVARWLLARKEGG